MTFLSLLAAISPRLDETHPVFQTADPVPVEFYISVPTTTKGLDKIKVNKATRSDGIPAWILRDFSDLLAAPLTGIFNSSADVVPVPKSHPYRSVERDIRPISLTPIAAKVFESIVLQWMTVQLKDKIDPNQF